MENASKALLIAGAVLIVILLIGIGMLIYSKSTGVIDTAASSMNSYEIQSFNSQFTPYEGMQRGSSVKSLISTIIANNATYKSDTNKQIYINFHDEDSITATTAEEMSRVSALIKGTANYEITLHYNDSGLVYCINIAR